MSEKSQNTKELADQAAKSKELLQKLIEYIDGTSRRNRQNAAAVLAQIAKVNPEVLLPYIDSFIGALDQSEAQTRWECLDTLTCLIELDTEKCEEALDGAETALFDEDNGFVRLASLRFLCKYGSTSEERSEKVWPLLDEAIQCYHGDYEYQDMLVALISFSEGSLSESVKNGLKERVTFDSEHGKGALKRRSQQIVENLN